jgi:hypothetical protein
MGEILIRGADHLLTMDDAGTELPGRMCSCAMV